MASYKVFSSFHSALWAKSRNFYFFSLKTAKSSSGLSKGEVKQKSIPFCQTIVLEEKLNLHFLNRHSQP